MLKEEILEIVKSCKNGMYTRETIFKNKFPEDYNCILKMEFPLNFTFPQKLYHYLNNDYGLNLGLCKCGKRCSFVNFNVGYKHHCCNSCSKKDDSTTKKMKETLYKKYGNENYNNRELFKKTSQEKYGVSSPAQTDEIKEKIKKTNIKKYGVSNPMKLEKFQKKAKQTNLKRYGVEHPQTLNEIKEKVKQTNLKRYGVEHPLQNKEVKNRLNEFFVKKYGVKTPFMLNCIKKKIKETNIKKYGVENPYQSDEIKKKIRQTNIEKYNVPNPMMSNTIKEKAKQTNLKKLGVEYPSQSEEVKEKIRKNNLKKYGVECVSQLEEIKERVRQTNVAKYGIEWFCNHPKAKKHSTNNSKPNILFEEKLKKCNVVYEREFPLTKYSYDFKIGNTLVEINPTITHNSYLNIFGGNPHKSDYHLSKSNTAKENGFHCIHIWDWDDEDKIVEMLKPKKTLYARNLEIKNVDVFTANNFLNNYHLQSTCKGQNVCLGLFLNNELVQLMTFGKPRYNKNYEWELLRLCSHSDYMVVGGSERLFSHFVKSHSPKSIVSYCDLSKFDGGVYAKLGFTKKGISKPTRHWYGKNKHITDNLLRQRGFDQLFNTNYGKGTSNEELMLEHGFLPVYDCGQATYVWINE